MELTFEHLRQDKERESGHRSRGSSLALPALVSPSIANVDRFTSDSIFTSSLVLLANARATPTNQVKEIPASRMEIVRRRFENKSMKSHLHTILKKLTFIYSILYFNAPLKKKALLLYC